MRRGLCEGGCPGLAGSAPVCPPPSSCDVVVCVVLTLSSLCSVFNKVLGLKLHNFTFCFALYWKSINMCFKIMWSFSCLCLKECFLVHVKRYFAFVTFHYLLVCLVFMSVCLGAISTYLLLLYTLNETYLSYCFPLTLLLLQVQLVALTLIWFTA